VTNVGVVEEVEENGDNTTTYISFLHKHYNNRVRHPCKCWRQNSRL